jgi:hypothetical protein
MITSQMIIADSLSSILKDKLDGMHVSYVPNFPPMFIDTSMHFIADTRYAIDLEFGVPITLLVLNVLDNSRTDLLDIVVTKSEDYKVVIPGLNVVSFQALPLLDTKLKPRTDYVRLLIKLDLGRESIRFITVELVEAQPSIQTTIQHAGEKSSSFRGIDLQVDTFKLDVSEFTGFPVQMTRNQSEGIRILRTHQQFRNYHSLMWNMFQSGPYMMRVDWGM